MQIYPSEKNIMLPLDSSPKEHEKNLEPNPISLKTEGVYGEKLNVRKLTLNKVHPYSAVEQMRMC